MTHYFIRMSSDMKQQCCIGGTLHVSDNKLTFIADREMDVMLNHGPFKGDTLTLNIHRWFIDRDGMYCEGIRRVNENLWSEDSMFFRFQPEDEK